MSRLWLLVTSVLVVLWVSPVLGEERRVSVLIPRNATIAAWPQGTQAVIAELAASQYQVVVESSDASELGPLLSELRSAANDPNAAGAVAVLRTGPAGIAYVWTRRDANVVQVHSDNTEGAVSEGALALRVLELIRARDLPVLEAAPPPPPPPPPRARPSPPKPTTTTPESARRPKSAAIWVSGGTVFAGGTSAPLVLLGLGARVPIFAPALSLDLGLGFSVVPFKLETAAGALDVNARQMAMHLVVEPWLTSALRVGLGAGLGAVWLSETGEPKPGYLANSDNSYVGLASARATGMLASGALRLLVACEPGILLPAASIRASGEEIGHVGRAWVSVTVGVGWSPL